MEFSQDIKDLLVNEFPGKDIYNMSLEELKEFRNEVADKMHECDLLSLANKLLGNASYGASANPGFFFFNTKVASDITAECRNLTKTMWDKFEWFFKEELWERKDLWKQFDFELDEEKHDWYRNQPVSVYSDTDSVYTTYGNLFKAMTPECQQKYDTDDKKVRWILKFNQEFLDKQNTQWCEEIYNPRNGKSIHEFELETISKVCIYQKKKKYIKALLYNKGKFYDHPKISGTGIELVKTTTPELARKIITEMTTMLLYDYDDDTRVEFMLAFRDRLTAYRKMFYNAPINDISASMNIGDYKKFVVDDSENLVLGMHCPPSVQACARYNYLAHKNHQDNKRMISGKMKYYAIRISPKETGFFGYPFGEYPSWAPPVDKRTQWQKTVIDPINRFLDAMSLEQIDNDSFQQLQLTLI